MTCVLQAAFTASQPGSSLVKLLLSRPTPATMSGHTTLFELYLRVQLQWAWMFRKITEGFQEHDSMRIELFTRFVSSLLLSLSLPTKVPNRRRCMQARLDWCLHDARQSPKDLQLLVCTSRKFMFTTNVPPGNIRGSFGHLLTSLLRAA